MLDLVRCIPKYFYNGSDPLYTATKHVYKISFMKTNRYFEVDFQRSQI